MAIICNYVVINLLSLNIIKYNNPCNYLDLKYRRVFKYPQHFLQRLLGYSQQSYLRQTQPFTLEKEMATPSSILAWKIHGQKSLTGLQPTGSQRVGYN